MYHYEESSIMHSQIPCYRWDTAQLRNYHFEGKRCGCARVRFDGSPN
jgi:hypothetical protein